MFVVRMSLPINMQNSPYIPVIERPNGNTAKSDNLADLTELPLSSFTIYLSPF